MLNKLSSAKWSDQISTEVAIVNEPGSKLRCLCEFFRGSLSVRSQWSDRKSVTAFSWTPCVTLAGHGEANKVGAQIRGKNIHDEVGFLEMLNPLEY